MVSSSVLSRVLFWGVGVWGLGLEFGEEEDGGGADGGVGEFLVILFAFAEEEDGVDC